MCTDKKARFDEFVQDAFRKEYCRINNIETFIETDFVEFSKEHLLFITITFSISNRTSKENVARYGACFRELYFHMSRLIVGNHFTRKQPLQPLTFYSFDCGGSRYGNARLNTAENLHIHALLLLHPDTLNGFKIREYRELQGSNPLIESMKIVQFDPKRGNFERLVSYVTKALDHDRDTEIYWDFLPQAFRRKFEGQKNWHKLLTSKESIDGKSQLKTETNDPPLNYDNQEGIKS